MNIRADFETVMVGLSVVSTFWDKQRAESALRRLFNGLDAWESLAQWERGNINRAVTVEPLTDSFLMCAGDGDDGATGCGATPTDAAISLCESIGLPLWNPPKPEFAYPVGSCVVLLEQDREGVLGVRLVDVHAHQDGKPVYALRGCYGLYPEDRLRDPNAGQPSQNSPRPEAQDGDVMKGEG